MAPLRVLSSLRLTVALLAMSMFIVLAGTVAQVDKGIWTVVREYFRAPFAWIDIRIFFPRSWEGVPEIGFYFPGGWLIGTALLVNLVAAHSFRFKVKASGVRLKAGLGVLIAGALLTWLAISSAFDRDFAAAPVDPYWRVTLELLKGVGAGLGLLAGCILVFRDRAGMVLLHGGIILMMLSELFTGLFAREGQMTVMEGETVSWVEDLHDVEVAVIDGSDPKMDQVVTIPSGRLFPGSSVRHEFLPFGLEVVRFYPNARVVSVTGGEKNHATAGDGLKWIAEPLPPVSGVDSRQGIDLPAAYVECRAKDEVRSMGVFLLSVEFGMTGRAQRVEIGGKAYNLFLRLRRTYKPYAIHLVDFRFDRYLGTNQPRNYSSDVRLIDEERKVERPARIWMNNPLRYRGDTLYQSSFTKDERGTVLQVVTNSGWMVPYVSCMIVAIGLLAHFGVSLGRFQKRRATA